MPELRIAGFETDQNHVVTLAMEGMDQRELAKKSNLTKIRVNGKPAPKPLLVDFGAQQIVFDASECETGKIYVEIQYLRLGPTVHAESDEDYQAPDQSPDHDGADQDSTTINLVLPKRAKPGERVKVSGRNFERLVDVQIDRQPVRITKAGNSALFWVPKPFKTGTYPIRFHAQNAGALVTSTARLEVYDSEENPY